jgi:hypothetical protein
VERRLARRNSPQLPKSRHDSLQLEQLVDALGHCKLTVWARADARGLDLVHRKVFCTFCTLLKRKTSTRGRAGLYVTQNAVSEMPLRPDNRKRSESAASRGVCVSCHVARRCKASSISVLSSWRCSSSGRDFRHKRRLPTSSWRRKADLWNPADTSPALLAWSSDSRLRRVVHFNHDLPRCQSPDCRHVGPL